MQKTTALSTAEAEYYTASLAGCEVLYLRDLLHRLGFTQKTTPRASSGVTTSSADGNVPSTSTSGKALRPRSHPEWLDAAGQGSHGVPDG